MESHRHPKVYNIFLPIFVIVFWPSLLWLFLIPLNYLLDRFVLRWSLGDMPDKGLFCRKHTWKICLAGFFSDFIGAAIMLAVFLLSSGMSSDAGPDSILEDLSYGIGFNPFSSILALIVVALAIAVSGLCIYLLDRKILRKAGLAAEQAKKSAQRLALITAPYLYLFPSVLLYGGELSVI